MASLGAPGRRVRAEEPGGGPLSFTEWDAATYDRISRPQARWGAAVLDRLELEGDERVLDAGCGSGKVTALLLERLPRGTVIALDNSKRMLEEAGRRFAGEPRVRLVRADLARPLPLEEPVDAVFSNATFHWVTDHDALFRNLAAVMRPGAQLVAQCGGGGNIASVLRALRAIGEDWPGPVLLAGPEETTRRLERAGFEDVRVWLSEEPERFEPGDPFETFLGTVVLRAHLERIPEPERAAYVRAVADHMPGPVIDYVRLNILARRTGSGRSGS